MTEQSNTVVVKRDVPARMVPSGTRTTIPENSFVNIRQALGGSYTVIHNGNMLRIDGTDADAINRETLQLEFDPPEGDGSVRDDDLWQVLRTVFDPEIPVNVVDLGLIYGCDVIRRDDQNVVQVRMTLTAPTCGMGPVLVGDVEDRLSLVPNVDKVEVELMFDPPWSRDMMSDDALVELGLF
jgi:probable FeS assembly SUF system protein SufT